MSESTPNTPSTEVTSPRANNRARPQRAELTEGQISSLLEQLRHQLTASAPNYAYNMFRMVSSLISNSGNNRMLNTSSVLRTQVAQTEEARRLLEMVGDLDRTLSVMNRNSARSMDVSAYRQTQELAVRVLENMSGLADIIADLAFHAHMEPKAMMDRAIRDRLQTMGNPVEKTAPSTPAGSSGLV